jgi:hypothetical protein
MGYTGAEVSMRWFLGAIFAVTATPHSSVPARPSHSSILAWRRRFAQDSTGFATIRYQALLQPMNLA